MTQLIFILVVYSFLCTSLCLYSLCLSQSKLGYRCDHSFGSVLCVESETFMITDDP